MVVQCAWCHKRRFSLTHRGDALCPDCRQTLSEAVTAAETSLREAEKRLSGPATPEEQSAACIAVIDAMEHLLPYERKGVVTTTPPPSAILSTYRDRHDRLALATIPDGLENTIAEALSRIEAFSGLVTVREAADQLRTAQTLIARFRRPPSVIAIINQKGGVGKTTSAISLGAGLARLGQNVLVVDLDPQANLTDGFGIEDAEDHPGVYELMTGNATLDTAVIQRNGVSILPATVLLAKIDHDYIDHPRRYRLLADALAGCGRYDYILIDCLPSLGLLTLNALRAAETVFIPVQPEYFALKGIQKLLDAVRFVQREGNASLAVQGILFTRFDPRKRHHREVMEAVKSNFPPEVMTAIVRESIPLAEAASYGMSVFEYRPASRGARDYLAICRRMLSIETDPGAALAPEPVRRRRRRKRVRTSPEGTSVAPKRAPRSRARKPR